MSMDILAEIRDAIRSRTTFLLTSHARPDGDSIGSQVAVSYTHLTLPTKRIV